MTLSWSSGYFSRISEFLEILCYLDRWSSVITLVWTDGRSLFSSNGHLWIQTRIVSAINFWIVMPSSRKDASLVAQLVKNPPAIEGDLGSIPGLGRSHGEGKGYPLQYSGLENTMDGIVHGVSKSQMQLSDFHFHFLPGKRKCLKFWATNIGWERRVEFYLDLLGCFEGCYRKLDFIDNLVNSIFQNYIIILFQRKRLLVGQIKILL